MPQDTKEHFLARISRGMVEIATASPVVTLSLAGIIAAISIVAGVCCIELHTSRADLLNPRNDYHRRWLTYVSEFSDREDVYVVVEGETTQQIRPILEEIAERLQEHPEYFESILYRVDKNVLKKKGLYYLPTQQLKELTNRVAELGSSTQLADPALSLLTIAQALSGNPSAETLATLYPQIVRSLLVLQQLLSGTGTPPLQLSEGFNAGADHSAASLDNRSSGHPAAVTADASSFEEEMFFSADGRLGLLVLRFTPDTSKQFTRFKNHIDLLRRSLREINTRHPEVKIGATGLPLLEFDEMKASMSSGTIAGVSLLGVMLVFFAGFGGIRYPLAVSLSLTTGVIWAVGYVTVAVGHLNILTSAFGAMLIGLGDYGVHFVSHYLDHRRKVRTTRQALIETASAVGPSIATGALTTAAAFFAGALTDFLGVAELGIIAGGGILLCWLADMTVLPSIICLIDRDNSCQAIHQPLQLAPWFAFVARAPRGITVGLAAATIVLTLGLPQLRYDYNLLNLQPVGLDSVETQNKLVAHMSRSSYFALSLAPSAEEARKRKEEFLRLPTVDRVEDLVSLIPEDLDEKQPLVQTIIAHLGPCAHDLKMMADSPVPPSAEIDQALAIIQHTLARQAADPALLHGIQALRGQLASIPHEHFEASIRSFRQMCYSQLPIAPGLLAEMVAEPPGFADLPTALVERFVGRSGTHLLQIYCKGDFWDPVVMRQFVADVRKVDPEATGNPVQIYEACHQMNQAYIQAALYALVAIVLALSLDFRNIRDVILCLIPLVLGMACLFGVMGWMDLPLNPANMITLPLILGIGIDNGVHVVHDFRRQGSNYRMPTNATLTAVVVNSLTTMVGFGALMLSPHQGLESLGRILTFGVGFTLITALLMPGLLRWLYGLVDQPARTDQWRTQLTEILEQIPAAVASGPPPVNTPIVPRRIDGDQDSPHSEHHSIEKETTLSDDPSVLRQGAPARRSRQAA